MKIIVENKLDQPIMCTLKDDSTLRLNGKEVKEIDKSNVTFTVLEWEKNGIVSISEAKAEEVVEDKKKKKSTEKVEDKEIKEEK